MSIYGGPDIITDGLILHLDAANTKSYPGSGTTWYDLSGNNNNFTLSGSVFSNNYRGTLSMGNNIRIHKNGPLLNKDNDLTIIFFVASGNFSYLEGHSLGCTLNYIQVTNTSTSLDQYGPSGTGSRTNLSYSSNTGCKIIAHKIASNRTANWFYNGTFSSGGTDETFSNFCGTLQETIIGNRTVNDNTNHSPVTGTLQMILVYSRELLDNEILQNYNALKGRFGL